MKIKIELPSVGPYRHWEEIETKDIEWKDGQLNVLSESGEIHIFPNPLQIILPSQKEDN